MDEYVYTADDEIPNCSRCDKKCFCPVCSKEMEVMNNGTID